MIYDNELNLIVKDLCFLKVYILKVVIQKSLIIDNCINDYLLVNL